MTSEKIQRIFVSVDEKVQSLIKPDRFYVALYDPQKNIVEFPWVVENRTNKVVWISRQPEESRLPDNVLLKGSLLHYERDVAAQIQTSNLIYWPEGEAPASWLGVPITFERKTLGGMFVESHIPGAFDQRAVSLLGTIASQMATAIERVRLDERLERRIRDLDAVNTFGQKLSSGIQLGESEILNLIQEQASELMDTDNMYIALYDQKTDTVRFELMLVDGKPTHVEPRIGGKGRTEWIIRNQKPILDLTKQESEAWYKVEGRQEYIGEPFASWIGVPMIVRKQVIGVIATYHKDKDFVYDELDLLILQSLANQAAIALDNARLLEQERAAQQKIVERETVLSRMSFAADFVHRINNLTGTIPVWVDLIRDYLRENQIDNIDLDEYLNNIEDEADNLLREAEKLKSPFQPVSVDIEDVLQSLVRQARIQMPVTVKIGLECQKGLPSITAVRTELANAFWNIIQNAIDAVEQSGKIEIELHLVDDSKLFEICISDDGPGIQIDNKDEVFKPFVTTKHGHTGYGLWRSKYVFESLKGSIDFRNREPHGTTFVICLPNIE